MQLTVDMLRTIMNAGYIIEDRSPVGGTGDFAILRVLSPYRPPIFDDLDFLSVTFPTFEEAAAALLARIDPPETMWSAVVRFDKGMGAEMRSLPPVAASTHEAALRAATSGAEAYAENLAKEYKVKILAVRVTPTKTPSASGH